MKSNHTPGPWTVEPVSTATAKWEKIIAVNEEKDICEISMSTHTHNGVGLAPTKYAEQARADARLIAVAPELLEALQQIADARMLIGEDVHYLQKIAKEAIAKATGEKEAHL